MRRLLVGIGVGLVAAAALTLVLVGVLGAASNPAPSASTLQSSVKGDITSHWHISGVTAVSCVMPSSWMPGKTFTCYAYRSNGSSPGAARGTVLPSSQNGGAPEWNLQWVPGL